MVVRQKNNVVESDETEDPAGFDGEESLVIENAIAELGDDADDSYVVVTRWSDKYGAWAKVDRVPASGFEPIGIMRANGPGKYIFRLYHPTPRGHRIKKQREMIFEGSTTPAAAAPQAGATPAGGFGSDAFTQYLLRQSEQNAEFTKAVMLAMLGNKGGGGAGISGADIVAAFKEGRESGRPAVPPPTAVEQMTELVELGITLANGGTKPEGENGASGILSHIPRVLDVIERFAGARASAQPAGAHAGGVPRGTLPAPAAADAEPMTPQARRLQVLRNFAPTILQEARGSHAPDLVGDYMATHVSGELKDALVDLVQLTPDDRRALLASADPALDTYNAWIEQVTLTLRDHWFGEDAEGDGASTGSAA